MSSGFVLSTQRERGFCFLLVFLLTCSFGWIKYSEFLNGCLCVCVCVSFNPTSYWIPLNKVIFRFESKWKRHTNLFWYLQINNAEIYVPISFCRLHSQLNSQVASCCMTTWIHIYPEIFWLLQYFNMTKLFDGFPTKQLGACFSLVFMKFSWVWKIDCLWAWARF